MSICVSVSLIMCISKLCNTVHTYMYVYMYMTSSCVCVSSTCGFHDLGKQEIYYVLLSSTAKLPKTS